ncbi:MAG TPA: hypothetical protein VL988_00835 [Solirubrobacteraceae bacterium]|nr:hypothetical protein [Solirubrobacteraceae bacterium]
MSEHAPSQPAAPDSATGQTSWRTASSAYHALFADRQPQGPVAGEIWTLAATTPTPDQPLVIAIVTRADSDAVTVVPLSAQTLRATEWDLEIPGAVLGYATVAQVKLAGTITEAQLRERLSSLPPAILGQLHELWDCAEQGASIPPEHLSVGPWVLDEADERLRARAEDARSLARYLHPSFESPFSQWETFGSILLRHSRAIGVDLERLIDPAWALKLAADRLDLYSNVPARRLAALLADLHIGWSECVKDALYRVTIERYTGSEVLRGAALGRRQGKRRAGARAKPSGEQREEAAGEYVDAVEKALSEL